MRSGILYSHPSTPTTQKALHEVQGFFYSVIVFYFLALSDNSVKTACESGNDHPALSIPCTVYYR